MFHDLIKQTPGVIIFPIISLVVFVAFFTGLTVYTWAKRKESYDEVSRIPLDSNVSSLHQPNTGN